MPKNAPTNKAVRALRALDFPVDLFWDGMLTSPVVSTDPDTTHVRVHEPGCHLGEGPLEPAGNVATTYLACDHCEPNWDIKPPFALLAAAAWEGLKIAADANTVTAVITDLDHSERNLTCASKFLRQAQEELAYLPDELATHLGEHTVPLEPFYTALMNTVVRARMHFRRAFTPTLGAGFNRHGPSRYTLVMMRRDSRYASTVEVAAAFPRAATLTHAYVVRAPDLRNTALYRQDAELGLAIDLGPVQGPIPPGVWTLFNQQVSGAPKAAETRELFAALQSACSD